MSRRHRGYGGAVVGVLCGVLIANACDDAPRGGRSHRHADEPAEHAVRRIPLAGAAASRSAELSGLAWWGESLILLPQYPRRFPHGEAGSLFRIDKRDILAYLDGVSSDPLSPRTVPFHSGGLERDISGFEGYEAIALADGRVYLTIEARAGGAMHGYVVAGRVGPQMSEVRLDPASLREVPPQTRIENASEEAILVCGDDVVIIHEVNGRNVNRDPRAHVLDPSAARDASSPALRAIGFPTVEYRITDATSADEDGRFWAINYLYPAHKDRLRPARDHWAERYGLGRTHQQLGTVERLIQFRYAEGRIVATDRPPVQLRLETGRPRNWEGIVRLDDRGFLLVTDQYPETILAFVSTKPQAVR